MTKILKKSDKFCMTKSPFEKKSDKFYKWSDKKSQINFNSYKLSQNNILADNVSLL